MIRDMVDIGSRNSAPTEMGFRSCNFDRCYLGKIEWEVCAVRYVMTNGEKKRQRTRVFRADNGPVDEELPRDLFRRQTLCRPHGRAWQLFPLLLRSIVRMAAAKFASGS